MRLQFDGHLLTAAVTVCFRGKDLELTDIIIDTGSSHTIFSPDALNAVGITYENGDPVYEAYGIGESVPFYTKKLDYIQIEDFKTAQLEIDIGILPKSHKGLLGLDILKTYGFIVDLDKLELYRS
ncbi:aspartyl protease family protein [Paenibacillus sp. NPDC058071]|uniref:aspartyl protease family protein n=1 Tax=Paenibacillus sp. NPDC058071 TaxID=3346326 RepID=UPI0036DC710B